eukprot:356968-Chlamydomonas_euryale.AAC.11
MEDGQTFTSVCTALADSCTLSCEVSNVSRQLLNNRVVETLDVLEHALVITCHKVDCNAFAAKAARAANAVQVVLRLARQVVVDDQRHLLHINAACQQVGRDEHARRARAELAHDDVPRVLVHVAVRRRYGVVALSHLVGQPVNLASCVGKDDRLRDGQRLVQVAQRVQLPILLVDVDVELLDTLEGKLITLDQNADRLVHELACDLQRLGWQRGGEDAYLDLGWQQLEDRKHLDGVRSQDAATEHIVHAAGRAHDDVHAGAKDAGVLAHRSAADACMALDLRRRSMNVYKCFAYIDQAIRSVQMVQAKLPCLTLFKTKLICWLHARILHAPMHAPHPLQTESIAWTCHHDEKRPATL